VRLRSADAQRPASAWLYLPGGAVAAALIGFPQALPPSMDLNSALRPLNALLLIGLPIGGGVLGRALSSRVAFYLGKSSYAMYILHGDRDVGNGLLLHFIEEPANR
jgi:peptidoglycan/LPS O-acetylase OafA/YrhL